MKIPNPRNKIAQANQSISENNIYHDSGRDCNVLMPPKFFPEDTDIGPLDANSLGLPYVPLIMGALVSDELDPSEQ